MITILPVLLAQLQAEHNSQKLKKDKYCILCIDKKTKQNNL